MRGASKSSNSWGLENDLGVIRGMTAAFRLGWYINDRKGPFLWEEQSLQWRAILRRKIISGLGWVIHGRSTIYPKRTSLIKLYATVSLFLTNTLERIIGKHQLEYQSAITKLVSLFELHGQIWEPGKFRGEFHVFRRPCQKSPAHCFSHKFLP